MSIFNFDISIKRELHATTYTYSNAYIFFDILALLRAYLPTSFPDAIAKANWWEFLVFIIMGLIGGVLSACFILANSKWIKFRRAYASQYKILE